MKDKHNSELTELIKRLIKTGKLSIEDILEYTEGADIRLVKEILDKLIKDITNDNTFERNKSISRSKTSYLPIIFPSANPLISQWWFTLDSIEKLSEKIYLINGETNIAFLGAPTVGYYHSLCFPETKSHILDIDENIVGTIKSEGLDNARKYNVYKELDDDSKGSFTSVVIDPPWYDNDIRFFLYRAYELLETEGYIFCMLPPRLTRPKIVDERNILLSDLIAAKFKIISLESNFVKYLIPPFEQLAFKDIDAIKTNPWRNGDVLIIKKTDESVFEKPSIDPKDDFHTFIRKGTKLRVFQKSNKEYSDLGNSFIEIPEFEKNVSTRKFNSIEICIWTTTKKAVKVKNYEISHFILSKWSEGLDKSETIKELAIKYPAINSNEIVESIDSTIEIWKNQYSTTTRKTPLEINTLQDSVASKFISKPSRRINDASFRADGFRLEFQRDRGIHPSVTIFGKTYRCIALQETNEL